MEQNYGNGEDHINYIMGFLMDERHIKIDGKQVFITYKTFLLPNPT